MGAWSTREQLAVARVLRDKAQLDPMGFTITGAARSVYHGRWRRRHPDFPAWLDEIRSAVDEPPATRRAPARRRNDGSRETAVRQPRMWV